MVLLDRYLPEFDFKERHQHDIPASQSEVMAQVLAYRPENDVFFRRMIGLREIPMRVLGRASAGAPPNPDPFGLENFTLLEQSGADEVAFGLVGKFWRLDYGQVDSRIGRHSKVSMRLGRRNSCWDSLPSHLRMI